MLPAHSPILKNMYTLVPEMVAGVMLCCRRIVISTIVVEISPRNQVNICYNNFMISLLDTSRYRILRGRRIHALSGGEFL